MPLLLSLPDMPSSSIARPLPDAGVVRRGHGSDHLMTRGLRVNHASRIRTRVYSFLQLQEEILRSDLSWLYLATPC